MSDYYWDEEVNQAIDEYINNKDLKEYELDRLYTKKIHPAFKKASESIVFTFNFHKSCLMPPKEVIQEAITKAYTILRMSRKHSDEKKYFDSEKGKSYSYWSWCIKNVLINLQDRNQRQNNKTYSYENDDFEYLKNTIDPLTYESEEAQDFVYGEYLSQAINWIKSNAEDIWSGDQDREVALTLIQAIENQDRVSYSEVKYTDEVPIYEYVRNNIDWEVGSGRIGAAKRDLREIFTRLRKLYNENLEIKEDDVIWMREKNYPDAPSEEELKKLRDEYEQLLKRRGFKSAHGAIKIEKDNEQD